MSKIETIAVPAKGNKVERFTPDEEEPLKVMIKTDKRQNDNRRQGSHNKIISEKT